MTRVPMALLAALLVLPSWAAEPAAPPAADASGTRQVRSLKRVMPTFSSPDEQAGGCVIAEFIIHPDGRVGEIGIVDSKPGTRYVPATIAALKQWRFEPFEPPALRAQQAFSFDAELVKLPDDAVRSPYAVATREGTLRSERCDAAPVKQGAAEKKP
jgi:hypothetical protein